MSFLLSLLHSQHTFLQQYFQDVNEISNSDEVIKGYLLMVWIIPILDSISKWLTKIEKNILSQIMIQLQTAILR